MNLDVYKDMPNLRVLYKVNSSHSLRSLSDAFPKVDFEAADDVATSEYFATCMCIDIE